MFWKRKPKPAAPSSDDPELEALRAALTKRQEEAAALEHELFDLQRFTAEVEAYLLPLQRRLEALRAEIAEARRRAARRGQWGARADSEDIPEARFYFDRSAPQAEAPPSPSPPPPAPEPPDEADIKALYRALAKRFHPDLTNDPEEKEWRQQRMAKVNAAYDARDLKALQALAAEPDRPPGAQPKTRADLLAEMQAEIERLNDVIANLERQLDELSRSPAVQLKLDASLARQSGYNLLGQIAAQLETEIANAEAELASLQR
jgi:predicted  nucleic acid-binding Zn-ribbon protein